MFTYIKSDKRSQIAYVLRLCVSNETSTWTFAVENCWIKTTVFSDMIMVIGGNIKRHTCLLGEFNLYLSYFMKFYEPYNS